MTEAIGVDAYCVSPPAIEPFRRAPLSTAAQRVFGAGAESADGRTIIGRKHDSRGIMTQKANAEINRAILEDVFPIECDLVGAENLDDLCEGHEDFAESDEAYRMDVGGSLEILANAVTVIGFVWTLLQTRRKAELPPAGEIDEIVLRSLKESNALTGEQRHAVYLALTVKRNAQPH